MDSCSDTFGFGSKHVCAGGPKNQSPREAAVAPPSVSCVWWRKRRHSTGLTFRHIRFVSLVSSSGTMKPETHGIAQLYLYVPAKPRYNYYPTRTHLPALSAVSPCCAVLRRLASFKSTGTRAVVRALLKNSVRGHFTSSGLLFFGVKL